MPRVKEVKRYPRLKVSYETGKCCGALVLCLACGYSGQADVIQMRSRRNGSRSLERCPVCKSLNIRCQEASLTEMVYHQLVMDFR